MGQHLLELGAGAVAERLVDRHFRGRDDRAGIAHTLEAERVVGRRTRKGAGRRDCRGLLSRSVVVSCFVLRG